MTHIAKYREKVKKLNMAVYMKTNQIQYLKTRVRELENRLAPYETTQKSETFDAVFEYDKGKVICAIQEYYPYFNDNLLMSKTRKREIVVPRQIWHTIMLLKGYTCKTVGLSSGKADHSVPIHSRRVVNDQCDVDPKFKAMFEKILKLAQ